MNYVLYNPLANNKHGKDNAKKLDEKLNGEKLTYLDITKTDVLSLFETLSSNDKVIIAGGDGTLNHFINSLGDNTLSQQIYYYPTGSGNDFMKDVSKDGDDSLILLNPYLKDLPVVTVNGKDYRFLNGIGYGIDGYCCEEGDKLQAKSDKKVNYTAIAIKGLLFFFKRANATITVDGVTHHYKKAWLVPTMNGRYYGGGMMIAPSQDRLNADRTVSTIIMYGSNKLKTLIVFPSIFEGKHINHTEMVECLTGHNIKVEFDRPTALQIDGETIKNVTSYSVRAEKGITLDKKEKAAAEL